MNTWLAQLGLRFTSAEAEAAFVDSYVRGKLRLTQGAMVLGGLLFYVFFIWDRIIDPVGAEKTHAIRGLIITPVIWVCALLLFMKSLSRWSEVLIITPAIIAAGALAIIYSELHSGFDHGAIGTVLVIFFAFSLLPVRVPLFVVFCVLSWGFFAFFDAISGNARPGMFLINNLSIGTSVLLGLFSSVLRELHARNQFRILRELSATRDRVRELQQSGADDTVAADSGMKIVVSYRRADSDAIAGRIRDRLVIQFGEDSVFMDIDSIPFGVDFRQQIDAALRNTDALIAIVGPNWLGAGAGRPRIHELEDPVRVELEAALTAGIPVVPVLVGGATMPGEADLPQSIKEMAFRNAAQVDAGRDFHQHVSRLIRSVSQVVAARRRPAAQRRM
jgi:hypothetical protein